MTTKKHKLLVLTSGGDAPGMNAAIRAVVRTACFYNIEAFGCHRGYQGLVDKNIFPMDAASVANCIQRGGTILETSRCKTFLEKSTRDQCRTFLKEHGIDFIVPIGGDGTFRGASLLESEGGPKSVGIPGSIDNDIVGSDYTIGYDTARNIALEAIDRIRDTASSHGRYFLVETMGHNTGFLAVDVAIAGGAEYVITPEFPMTSEVLAEKLNKPIRKKQSMIIIVAESKQPGRSIFLAERLHKLTPFEYRVCILGHTQRGGSPTAMDRLAGSFMGNLAVETLLSGKSNCMTVLNGTKYETAPYPDPTKPGRCLTDEHMIQINNILAT